MAADPAKAYGTGLRPRPLADTVRDTWAWMRDAEQPDETGITGARADLLTGGRRATATLI